MKKLETYRRKRNFGSSPEPEGVPSTGNGNRFVIHKHSATADHYDLRLEHEGVLLSWAVPKGPSLNPEDKRYAVRTEDHPLEYSDFEGVIPQGEYGGGPMIVWDRGVWAPMDNVEKSLSTGNFKFRLAGEKLSGGWMLARLKNKDEKESWILFKERDQAADPSRDILAERPESVKSGRRIEELVAPPPVPVKPRPASRIKGAVKALSPPAASPQLASPTPKPPLGNEWLHEIKLDGYRTLAYVENGATKLITRSGLDWTRRYGDLPSAFTSLPCKSAVLDGEIVALDAKGVSSLSLLQEALSSGPDSKLVFYAFDLLYLDGWDLTQATLADRKRALQPLVAGNHAIHYSDHVDGDPTELFERVCELGLEGLVSKRKEARYRPGRSESWLKAKAPKRGSYVVAGFSRSKATAGLASLAMGEWVGAELVYRGKVGTGFDAEMLSSLYTRLEALGEAEPLPGAPRDIVWVDPVLVAQISYGDITRDGMLRHAVFKGLRQAELTAGAPFERKRLVTDADLAGIWVTNPTRRLFGRSGPTKLDIAVYYAAVGDFMLPHILDRPVSMLRCPSPKSADCFFQRHAFTGMPPTLQTAEIKNSEGEERSYLVVADVRAYLALAQFGVVEFHAWGSKASQIEKPDRIVFDLDPGEGVGWREVVEAAVHIRGELEAMGLVPFVKTSGGSGVHIVVPLEPKLGWKPVHAATKSIASKLAITQPKTFTTTMGAENRKGRIFIDFHRNARTSTAVAAYSLRARVHMPASTPISWSDLESIDAPTDLNYSTLPRLLETAGDPWADINNAARALPERL